MPKNIQNGLTRTQRYRQRHPDAVLKINQKQRAKWKRLVFDHYGWECKMCGSKERLVLDHINEDGRKHRAKIGVPSGWMFYRWVAKHGYPDDLQTLCKRCNEDKARAYKKWVKEVKYGNKKESTGA